MVRKTHLHPFFQQKLGFLIKKIHYLLISRKVLSLLRSNFPVMFIRWLSTTLLLTPCLEKLISWFDCRQYAEKAIFRTYTLANSIPLQLSNSFLLQLCNVLNIQLTYTLQLTYSPTSLHSNSPTFQLTYFLTHLLSTSPTLQLTYSLSHQLSQLSAGPPLARLLTLHLVRWCPLNKVGSRALKQKKAYNCVQFSIHRVK